MIQRRKKASLKNYGVSFLDATVTNLIFFNFSQFFFQFLSIFDKYLSMLS